MKRVITYLFLVFGFTLILIIKSFAAITTISINSFDKKFICFQDLSGTIFVGSSEGKWLQTIKNPESLCNYFIYDEYHPKDYEKISARLKKFYGWSETSSIRYPINDSHVLKYLNKKYSKVRHKRTVSKIIKAEPDQSQKAQELDAKKKAEAKKKRDEERRKAEAKKRKEEERRKAEAEKKRDEERRKAEAKKRKEEERRKAEAEKKREEDERNKETNAKLYVIGSGTGFFVSAEGHIVSNDHVVGICKKVASKIDGEIEYFNILNTDQVNDLGIIKGKYKSPNYLSIKSDGAEYGEDIVAFGYPLADALSTSVKLTKGIVSALSGPGNNYSEIQIDAAIQPGNSGGPVLNYDGLVVGVASSGLNKLYMLEKSEYIPENVNFAVSAPTLANFLKANGVKVNTKKFEADNTMELAAIGRPATLQLFCMNTKAAFEQLKQKKKHSDVLFEKVIDLR